MKKLELNGIFYLVTSQKDPSTIILENIGWGKNKFISLKLLKPVDIFNSSTKVLSTEFYLDTTDLAFCLLPSFQSILNSIPQFVVLFKFIDF